ncbi:LPS-assembly protein LptD [Alkalilacustris brevis]|uniref:LPS-assembly protein LptD n=1 Tax=Alkalilacustris brevis TaxID=2026338 RepID=UPI000E0E077B|nr:LPS assembly protein LptD [Alkalilacustris brevis]
MPRLLALALALVALLMWQPAGPAAAQGAGMATLVADSLSIEADDRLIAEGNVEVLYDGALLRAGRITYSRAQNRLEIEGPITLSQEGGDFLLLADSAELSDDLHDGLLRSARVVLDRRLQMASREVARIGGRYTQLTDSVASSCQVCAENPTPLWEIRAARITHDSETRQIHFEQAQFRVMGVPLVHIPRLRLPDPTVERATGFLAPALSSGGTLGTGISIPYFIALAPDRDLTITPRITTGRSFTFGARYRQAFQSGNMTLTGALTRDRIRPGRTRGYLFGTGRWQMAGDITLGFDIEAASDRTYLDDYGITSAATLESTLFASRLRRDSFSRARITHFRTLTDGVSNARLPQRVIDLRHEQRFAPPGLGGVARLSFDLLAAYRQSDDATAGLGHGRDMTRASLRADWRRDWVLPGGVLAAALGEVQVDRFAIRQDDDFPSGITRTTPAAALELRWPWVGASAGGARHVIEPVAQLVWAPRRRHKVPNEVSRLAEFDEASLFALHRYPGFDARESGNRANLGVSWTRFDPAGWSLGATVGRILRPRGPRQFSDLSGLDGRRSDWLAAVQFESAQGLSLLARAVIEPDGALRKNELRVGLSREGLDLTSSLTHLTADPDENRNSRSTEWNLDAAWQVTPNWTALADWRYDIDARQAARIGLGAQFRNECLLVDVSLSRRFASSTSVSARTDFGLSVDLLGFGSQPSGPARACAQ